MTIVCTDSFKYPWWHSKGKEEGTLSADVTKVTGDSAGLDRTKDW